MTRNLRECSSYWWATTYSFILSKKWCFDCSYRLVFCLFRSYFYRHSESRHYLFSSDSASMTLIRRSVLHACPLRTTRLFCSTCHIQQIKDSWFGQERKERQHIYFSFHLFKTILQWTHNQSDYKLFLQGSSNTLIRNSINPQGLWEVNMRPATCLLCATSKYKSLMYNHSEECTEKLVLLLCAK